MENKKKILLILVILLLAIVVPFSLAIFIAMSNTESILEIEVETVDNKTLIFDNGDEIFLDVNISDFSTYGTDALATTSPSVRLTGKGNEEDKYSVFLYIYNNTVVYSLGEDQAELLLKIYDEKDEEITYLEDIEYVTTDGVSGFDVTGLYGVIPIKIDNFIETNASTTIHNWTFELIFKSLVENQNLNLGKKFNAQICLAQSVEKCDFVGFSDVILIQNGGTSYIESKGDPDFAKAAITKEDYDTYYDWCTNETYCDLDRATYGEDGMYATEDPNGTTYYYRGAVDNNWVVFGKEDDKNIYWRIVRVEGSENVKMIYSGTTPPTEDDAVTMESTSIQLSSTSVFNTSYNSTVYAGYVYQTGVLHGTSTSSTVKGKVDAWYNTNLASDYGSYIEPSDYCIDRVTYSYSGSGYGAFSFWDFIRNTSQVVTTTAHVYQSSSRLTNLNEASPNLICETPTDVLTLNVGLIGADEVALAGGRMWTHNNSFYLHTNTVYHTLSPSHFNNNYASYSNVYYGILSTGVANVARGIRPTISLSSDLFVSQGNGTWDNPYVISLRTDTL